jgi:hypothetical protein
VVQLPGKLAQGDGHGARRALGIGDADRDGLSRVQTGQNLGQVGGAVDGCAVDGGDHRPGRDPGLGGEPSGNDTADADPGGLPVGADDGADADPQLRRR